MEKKNKAPKEGGNGYGAGGATFWDKDNSFSETSKTFDRGFASKNFPYFLFVLKEHGGNLSFGEYSHYLQDTTGEDWNAISPTITKLCDAGYIYADRKESIYTLTVAGYDYINSTQTPAAETKFAEGDTTATQMPDTVVNEGDNSQEPPADASPPGYDDYFDTTAKEIAEEADYDPFADDPEEPVNEAPAPQQPEAMAKEQRLWVTARELLENPVTELPFLVEGLFPQVGIAACVGDSDVGKSAFLRQLGLSIVTGKPDFVGFKLNTKYKKALYVFTEDGREAINFLLGKQNIRMQAELADLEGLDFTFIENFDPCNAPQVIEERIRSAGAVDLVVLDGYGDLLKGNPNDFQNVRHLLQQYRVIANRHECLIIFLHHVKKSARNEEPTKHNVNGSQGFEAAMRTVIELREEEKDPLIKHLCITKGNYISKSAKTDSFQLCFDEATLTFSHTGERVSFDLLVPQSQSGDERRQKYEKANELKARGFTQEQIAKELGYKSRGSVSKLFKTYGADS